MNSLYKCWPDTEKETSQCDEAIVVRINGNITDSKLVDRPREIRNLKLLNSRGIANKTLGYIWQWHSLCVCQRRKSGADSFRLESHRVNSLKSISRDPLSLESKSNVNNNLF